MVPRRRYNRGTVDRALDLVNFLCVLVLSTAFHEMAHAWLADRFGDGTPREHGRMTLNPLAHIHPVYTVLLPAVFYWNGSGFFAAAWTPVNPARMRRPRLHRLLVSLGGPGANLVLAMACFVVFAIAFLLVDAAGGTDSARVRHMLDIARLAVHLNVALAILNLVPIPPLDGADLVGFLLPSDLRARWEAFRVHAWIVLLILMATGILGRILHPVLEAAGTVVALGFAVVEAIAGG